LNKMDKEKRCCPLCSHPHEDQRPYHSMPTPHKKQMAPWHIDKPIRDLHNSLYIQATPQPTSGCSARMDVPRIPRTRIYTPIPAIPSRAPVVNPATKQNRLATNVPR
jgi:hypothetical protein